VRTAPQITLSDSERATLTKWSRGRSTPARLVTRACIVLMAAEGKMNKDIAASLHIRPNTVVRWRARFAEDRIAGIEKDAPRGGRHPTQRNRVARLIIEKTTREKPANATHWSTRSLAKALGTNKSTVHRVWEANGLAPHRTRTFKVSNDPQFVEKVVDVVGLYLDPPEHALVLSVDEKSQIQALDRTQRCLPLFAGYCETMTHDYVRHGTTTLFAAIELAQGRVIGTCMPRHRHQEFIRFLKVVDAQTPSSLDLHLILDNYATHKHPRVRSWLRRHPRFHLHFIPTSSSWLNIIERWFAEITNKRLRRSAFRSVRELETAIRSYIDDHNADPQTFTWTASAQRILEKVSRARAVLDKTSSE
jgi:transposase